jgi:hypothetical protein
VECGGDEDALGGDDEEEGPAAADELAHAEEHSTRRPRLRIARRLIVDVVKVVAVRP